MALFGLSIEGAGLAEALRMGWEEALCDQEMRYQVDVVDLVNEMLDKLNDPRLDAMLLTSLQARKNKNG